MKDEIKKLGLRVRERPAPRQGSGQSSGRPGKISFDEHGNARLEWSDESSAENTDAGESESGNTLEQLALSIVDDDERPGAAIQPNVKGLRVGYNPYQSGLLVKKEWKPKRSLQELSKWVNLKRKLNNKAG